MSLLHSAARGEEDQHPDTLSLERSGEPRRRDGPGASCCEQQEEGSAIHAGCLHQKALSSEVVTPTLAGWFSPQPEAQGAA